MNSRLSVESIDGIEQLTQLVDEYDISTEDICLVGSSALAVRGLRDNGDIDIVIAGGKGTTNPNGFEKISIQSRKYTHLGISDNDLIYNKENYDEVDGFKITRPEIVYSHKKLKRRDKDIRDIGLLHDYRKQTGDWNPDLVIESPDTGVAILITRGKDSIKEKGAYNTIRHGVPSYIQYFAPKIKFWDYYAEPTSIPGKAYRSYRADGMVKTLARGVRLIKLYEPTGYLDRYSGLRHKAKIGTLVERKLRLEFPTGELLGEQYQNGRFNQWDIIVRLLAAEKILNDEPISDVIKTFEEVSGEQVITPLTDLLTKKSQALEQVETTVSYSGKIIETNRLAVSLAADPCSVPVKISSGETTAPYPFQWFDRSEFSEDDIELLKERFTQLLYDSGGLFVFVLWPPAQPYVETIVDKIQSEQKLHFVKHFNLSDDMFENFVRDMYEMQGIREEHVETKVDEIGEIDKKIVFGGVELAKPRIREGKSHEMNEVKERVRREFAQEVLPENPSANILMHSTDNFTHNRQTWDVIEEYYDQKPYV